MFGRCGDRRLSGYGNVELLRVWIHCAWVKENFLGWVLEPWSDGLEALLFRECGWHWNDRDMAVLFDDPFMQGLSSLSFNNNCIRFPLGVEFVDVSRCVCCRETELVAFHNVDAMLGCWPVVAFGGSVCKQDRNSDVIWIFAVLFGAFASCWVDGEDDSCSVEERGCDVVSVVWTQPF